MRKVNFFHLILTQMIILFGVSSCIRTASSFTNPSQVMQKSDLVGVWEAHYDKNRVDRLIIREDGTYKQVYAEKIYAETISNYVFETGWNLWWLGYFTDGRVYIHFDKGRYYLGGIEKAESNGRLPFCLPPKSGCVPNPENFWDPYANEFVQMLQELVLTIRIDDHGNIVFHHFWTSSDRGFAIFGGQKEMFFRVENRKQ